MEGLSYSLHNQGGTLSSNTLLEESVHLVLLEPFQKQRRGRDGAILSSSPEESLWEATARRAGDFEKEVGWRGRHSRDGFPWFRV